MCFVSCPLCILHGDTHFEGLVFITWLVTYLTSVNKPLWDLKCNYFHFVFIYIFLLSRKNLRAGIKELTFVKGPFFNGHKSPQFHQYCKISVWRPYIFVYKTRTNNYEKVVWLVSKAKKVGLSNK